MSTQSENNPRPSGDRYDTCQEPDFIYGGPFIPLKRPEPFLDSITPINLELQGTFKKSFAYYSMKERIPIILTKVIDSLSKRADADSKTLIEYIARLKNEIVTNKKYAKFQVDSDEADQWNEWLDSRQAGTYFTDVWVFAECYVYRRLREGCELIPNMQNFDPFAEQKKAAFDTGLEAMCMVATKLLPMLSPSEKDKRKQDFVALLKICLWSNKCDLSLSGGEPVSMESGEQGAEPYAIDPFQMIVDFKDKLLADDTNKIADQVEKKADAISKAIEKAQREALEKAAAEKAAGKGKGKGKAKPPPPPPPPPEEGAEPPPPPTPCPAKVTVPSQVQFDIVCDNVGFELFADLCLASFLVEQKIVQRVRFYLKKIPWLVSDVMPKDFYEVIDMCCRASYSRTALPKPPPPPPKKKGKAEPAPAEPPPPGDPITITSEALQQLGHKFKTYADDGTFIISAEDFWTSPHVYKDMKKYDYWLYRKLQYACAVLFKGDLNYRKLVGERNWPSTTAFLAALQGFQPAPVIACRTVKCELICGLKAGKADAAAKVDPKWMQTGDFGVIQFCPKAEPLKVADRPCKAYCAECLGLQCPDEEPFW